VEKWAAAGFVAIAIACGVISARWEAESDPSRLVRVDATFRWWSTQHDKSGDRILVDATYRVNGRTIEHVVPEAYATNIGATVPGHGTILVDPNDPLHPPRVAPAALAGVPLLATILSASLASLFGIAAWRRRKDAQAPA
jgi:hypothetical protein